MANISENEVEKSQAEAEIIRAYNATHEPCCTEGDTVTVDRKDIDTLRTAAKLYGQSLRAVQSAPVDLERVRELIDEAEMSLHDMEGVDHALLHINQALALLPTPSKE